MAKNFQVMGQSPGSINSWASPTAEHGPRKSLPGDEIEEEEEEKHCCATFCCCLVDRLPQNARNTLTQKIPNVGWIVICAVLGIIVGVCFGGQITDIETRYLKLLGGLWMNGLKCVVLPFVFTNMITSIADVRALKGSKNSAKMTFLWYFLTTLLAVSVGVFFSTVMLLPNQNPITDANRTELIDQLKKKSDLVKKHKFNTAEQPAKIAEMFVTDNIVKSMLSFDLIAIISVGIIIGLFIETPELNGGEGRAGAPKKSFVFIAFMREINKVCFKLIAILVAFTPIGVFSLVAAAVAQSNLGSLMKDIGLFLATVLSGLAFHALIVYPCLFFLFTRSNPFRVMKNVMPAFLTAMSTASSAATFPVTYRNAVDNNKVRPSTAKFVLSLGMTMNMDGTAIGFPCAVIFMANASGMTLTFGQIVGMAFTSAMASMGAGPIPSAGLVMLVSILSSVGIDATTNPIFGLIIAVDWVYDRPETALNIFGDSLGAVVVDRYTAKSNEDGLAGTEMTNTA